MQCLSAVSFIILRYLVSPYSGVLSQIPYIPERKPFVYFTLTNAVISYNVKIFIVAYAAASYLLSDSVFLNTDTVMTVRPSNANDQ